MADRGMIVKWFEFCRVEEKCPVDCPYWDNNGGARVCTKELAKDVLTLLKEQETVEPYMDYDGRDVWRCGNCGATIFHLEHSQADEDWKSYAKFCRHCGQAVKWE